MMASSKLLLFCLILSLLLNDVVADCTQPGGICCNVCRNGGVILNPEHEFVMEDTINGKQYEWSCGWLEENLAAVNAGETGAAGEARYCAVGQYWANRECECSGEPIPEEGAYDPNPACDLCGQVDGKRPPLDFVPAINENVLVPTGVAGPMPCGGLYYSLSEGVLEPNLCPIVQRNAGDKCCRIPAIDGGDLPVPPDTQAPGGSDDPTCIDPGQECEFTNMDCCLGFECRQRAIGLPKICSAQSGGGAGRGSYYRRGSNRGGSAGQRSVPPNGYILI